MIQCIHIVEHNRVINTTNKDLAKWFRELNARFFENRIDANIQVRFAISEDDLDQLGDDCDGAYIHDLQTILISKTFRKLSRITKIVVLHEMIHAEFPEHISDHSTEDHGLIFQHRLVDLFHQGAYDGLLMALLAIGLSGFCLLKF